MNVLSNNVIFYVCVNVLICNCALFVSAKKKAETEEMLLKKSERNRKRKQRAAQRREEVKVTWLYKS